MLGTTRLINNTSAKHLSQLNIEQYIPEWSTLGSQTSRSAVFDLVTEEDINQKLRSIPDTIISLQYNSDDFLTFRVCQAKQGEIVKSGTQVIGFQCQIGNSTYIFKREHLNQMSKRERCDLCNYLKVNDSQVFSE